ncbi:MAG TPA: tetratricopeptide repeat protein, partial [Nannocystaceae bacterium]|nr:tetratricopeptide repeat protein [Nannocystaceae bacterium]
ADGRVRVADFGLARAIDAVVPAPPFDDAAPDDGTAAGATAPSARVDRSSITESGAILGTPLYMSPEQHAGAAVDVRTDVYSFCVALFVALVGSPPFSATTVSGLYAQKIAGTLRWPPHRARPTQWLVALLERGLRPEPSERFADMDELRVALAAGRRRARWRWPVMGIAAAALAGVVAAAGADAHRCDGAAAEIAEHWTTARADDLASSFARASPIGAEQWPTIAGDLERWSTSWIAARTQACEAAAQGDADAMARLDERVACLDRALASFTVTLDLFERADAGVVEHARQVATKLATPGDCFAAIDTASWLLANDTEAAAALTHRLAQLDVDRYAGRLGQRVADLQQAAAQADTLDAPLLRARAHLLYGHALRGSGAPEQAIGELETAHAIAYEHGMGVLEEESAQTLAIVLGKQLGRTSEGLRWVDAANGAIERYELSDESRALVESDTGGIHLAAGDVEAAIQHLERAVALAEALPASRTLGTALNELALAQARQRDFDAALATRERAVLVFEDALGPGHPLAAASRVNLASSLRDVGRPTDAEPVLERALDELERAYGVAHRSTVIAANELGALRDEVLHDPEGGLRAYARALAGAEQLTSPAERLLVAGVRQNYADVLWELGRYGEALPLHRQALSAHEDLLGPEHTSVANGALRVGHDAVALDLEDDARSALQRALAIATRTDDDAVAAHSEFALAVLLRVRDPARARELATSARDRLASAGPERTELIAEWIAALDGHGDLPSDWRARAGVQRLAVGP